MTTYDPSTLVMLASAAEGGGDTGYTVGFILIGVFGLGWLAYAIISKHIGFIVAVSIGLGGHSLLLFGSDLFSFSGGDEIVEEDDLMMLSPIEMPEIVVPLEEPEMVEGDETEDVPIEVAPPSIADVPSAVSTSDFIQKPTPPPPPDAVIDRNAMTIPVNRSAPKTNMDNLFDIKDLDQIPVVISTVEPNFPYELKRQGVSGTVVIEFIVNTKGQVQAAFVIRSTHAEFEQPVLLALQKWRFRPGKKGGRAVNTRMRQPFKFTLNADSP